jgi:hypothetical protein
MKLTFKQKNLLRLGSLLVMLAGILVFIYFQLKDETDQMKLTDLERDLSSNEKEIVRKSIDESGGLKMQQYATEGAMRNNDKISIEEVAKIHSLDNE